MQQEPPSRWKLKGALIYQGGEGRKLSQLCFAPCPAFCSTHSLSPVCSLPLNAAAFVANVVCGLEKPSPRKAPSLQRHRNFAFDSSNLASLHGTGALWS